MATMCYCVQCIVVKGARNLPSVLLLLFTLFFVLIQCRCLGCQSHKLAHGLGIDHGYWVSTVSGMSFVAFLPCVFQTIIKRKMWIFATYQSAYFQISRKEYFIYISNIFKHHLANFTQNPVEPKRSPLPFAFTMQWCKQTWFINRQQHKRVLNTV